MAEKERADVLLVEKGYCVSRERAKAAIMAGRVFVGGKKIEKAGTLVSRDDPIEVRGEDHPYVSRGGLKLEKALRVFEVSARDRVVVDIGASTGGFTDCLLQHGARLVYAVDVGYGQLAWKLRQDPRVVPIERMNARHLRRTDLNGPDPEQAVMDVSFISIRLILPVLRGLLPVGGDVITLIKPQFEAGREGVGRKGIVRDPATHVRVLQEVLEAAERDGFAVKGLTFSPVKGGSGNIEFLAHLQGWDGPNRPPDGWRGRVAEVVEQAHQSLE
ncbi:MAG: TlyA family RNA methyltransferase [Alicyclobacillaceae bacterium]|nr:TlyA family RNA methyltransferase [Alicyclobacillaceae bacterium]